MPPPYCAPFRKAPRAIDSGLGPWSKERAHLGSGRKRRIPNRDQDQGPRASCGVRHVYDLSSAYLDDVGGPWRNRKMRLDHLRGYVNSVT